jgi:GNAT superfamily N-acetyltransferase/predicted small metal-binding protein
MTFITIKCFECDLSIETDTVESVVDRFVEHGRESHDWSYPAEAIRNYARNYAEATQRLSADVERKSEIGEVTIRPVSEDNLDHWLYFFDHDAFAGNPDWASCYCLEPHDPAPPELPERPWRETRDLMVDRLRSGGGFGYLGYVDGTTAGWVNASLRSDYSSAYDTTDPDDIDPASVIGVTCFIISPEFRRHGIASRLLDRVIADAGERGASWIEGYPFNDATTSESQHYFRGRRSMYDARGFGVVEVRERDTVMRRPAVV